MRCFAGAVDVEFGLFADSAVSACAAAAECSLGHAVGEEGMFHGEAALEVDSVGWLDDVFDIREGEIVDAGVEGCAFNAARDGEENEK